MKKQKQTTNENNMKIQILIQITITLFVVNLHAVSYIVYPFTNMHETVYIDGGKHLLRVEYHQKGEFIINEGTEIIGESSFETCRNITSVFIPDSITVIMKNAFANCESLTNIVFGSGLEIVDERAFQGCHWLTRIELPDSLETLGEYAFPGSRVNEIIVGSGLRNLGKGALGNDNLITNWLGQAINITISPDNKWIHVENGRIVSTYPKKETKTIYINKGKILRQVDANHQGDFIVNEGTEIIGKHAFGGCNEITSIVLPNSVRIIQDNVEEPSCAFGEGQTFVNHNKKPDAQSISACFDRLIPAITHKFP